jgi:hypothetical protein
VVLLRSFYLTALKSDPSDDVLAAAWEYATANADSELMVAIARLERLPDGVLAKVAATKRAEVRVAYLQRADIPPQVLRDAVASESRATVLAAWASSPSCPAAMLDALAAHPSTTVRIAVLANPSTSADSFSVALTSLSARWSKLNYPQRGAITEAVTEATGRHQWVVDNCEAPSLVLTVLRRSDDDDAIARGITRLAGICGDFMADHELGGVLRAPGAGHATCDAIDAWLTAHKRSQYARTRLQSAVAAHRALLGDIDEDSPEVRIPTLTDPGELDRYRNDALQVPRISDLLLANPHLSAATFLHLLEHGRSSYDHVAESLQSRDDSISLVPEILAISPMITTAVVSSLYDDVDDGVEAVLAIGNVSAVRNLLHEGLLRADHVERVPWVLVAQSAPTGLVAAAQSFVTERLASDDAVLMRRRWARFNDMAGDFHGTLGDLVGVCLATA